jgi:hypothetical protein
LITVACSDDTTDTVNTGGTGGSSAGKNNNEAGDDGNGGKNTSAGKNSGGTGGSTAGTGGTTPKAGTSAGGDAGMGGILENGGEGGLGGYYSEGGAGGEGGAGEPATGPLAHCQGCIRTKIGKPIWEISGVVVLAGDVGTDSFDPMIAFLENWTKPNHKWWGDPDYLIGPDKAHAGPYNDELYTLATAKNLKLKQTFSKAEFTGPKGVWVAFNIIPGEGAPTGSSFDSASGPILPKAIFPLTEDGDTYRNGELYDPFFDGSFSGQHNLHPPIDKDGASHLFWFFGEDNYFGPENTPNDGSYEFYLKITDATGRGWNLTVPYTVTPN